MSYHYLAGLPDKRTYAVAEVVQAMADHLGISSNAAMLRIYRRIRRGVLPTVPCTGPTRVSQEAVIQLLRGDIE